MQIKFILNGAAKEITSDPLCRLLDVLRDDFGLTSVKEGCGEGECGACLVLMDGKAVNSCLIPMGMVSGKEILTLEGFAQTERYKVIEASFLEAGAVQCGFCTPGIVMSTEGLLRKNPQPDDEHIQKALEGNLCRCTGYRMIFEGVKLAAQRGEGLW